MNGPNIKNKNTYLELKSGFWDDFWSNFVSFTKSTFSFIIDHRYTRKLFKSISKEIPLEAKNSQTIVFLSRLTFADRIYENVDTKRENCG